MNSVWARPRDESARLSLKEVQISQPEDLSGAAAKVLSSLAVAATTEPEAWC